MCNPKSFLIRSFVLLVVIFTLSMVNLSVALGEEKKVQKITVLGAKQLYDSGAVFVDTRSDLEQYFGVIKDSVEISKSEVNEKASDLIPDKERAVVTYCVSGVRANVTAENLIKQGYKNVYVIDDAGYFDWKKAGYPTVKEK